MRKPLIDPSLAGPCLFWFWNDTPTPELIDSQLAAIADAGFSGVYVHPMPQSFRPGDFNGGMSVEYLSPAFFELIAHACQTMRRLGLTMWFYDEGGWPSGMAGGQVVQENSKHGIWLLEKRDGTIAPTQMTDGFAYPDLMNPAATAAFIRLTHERYKHAVGAEFGKTVRGTFTDEARLIGRVGTAQIPWTPAFARAFADDHGYDLTPRLPHLFEPPTDDARRQTQQDYVTTLGRLIAENYYRPIQEWCEVNGLLFEGHHSGEDDFARHGQYFGDYLEQARHYHIPGVDTIWRQLFPGKPGGNFVRLASSAAWKRGDRIVVSESFAVYGPGLTLEQMRWLTAFQAVHGVSKIGVMANHLSSAGARWVGLCSDVSPRSPAWPHVRQWTDYVRDVSQFVCRGDAFVNVGVYYRGELTDSDQAEAFTLEHERVLDALGDALIGWAFVNKSDLDAADVGDNVVAVGRFRLSAIVVHTSGPLSSKERETFDRISTSGVRVISADEKNANAVAASLADLSPLGTDRPLVGIRMLALQSEGWAGCLLFNSNSTAVDFKFEPRPSFTSAELYPHPIGDESVRSPGHAVRLQAGQLLAFCTDARPIPARRLQLISSTPVNGSWRLRLLETHTITDAGVQISRDQVRADDVDLLDTHSLPQTFSGTASYSTVIDLPEFRSNDRFSIDFGSIHYAAELFINGSRVGSRAWPPFVFDVTSHVRAGANTVELRVRNTLANAWLDALSGQGRRWRNLYSDRAEPFARESVDSGLKGPVVITRSREGE